MDFRDYWKKENTFEKSKAGFEDVVQMQKDIALMKARGVSVTSQIDELHKMNKELIKARHEKLTEKEIAFVRSMVEDARQIGMNATKTINRIQANIPKLRQKWRAERAYWTEVKRDNTKAVADIGDEEGFDKYKVILSPLACRVCRSKTDGGRKIFTQSELSKSGYGHAPPFHPNCFCIAVPHVE